MLVRWFTVLLVCLSLALPCPCDHGDASAQGAKDCCGNPLVDAFAAQDETSDTDVAASDEGMPAEAPSHEREGCPHCDEVRSVNADTLDRLAAASAQLPSDDAVSPLRLSAIPIASWHEILTTTLRASRPPPLPHANYVLPTPSRSLHLRLGVLLC